MKTSNVSQERWFMGSRSCFAAPSPEIEKSGNGVGTEHRTPCALATHELVIPTTLSSRYVAEVTGLSFALPLFSHWRSYKWSPNGVGGEGWELFLVFYSFSNSKYINSTRSTTNERETLRVTLPLALQWHTRTVRPFPSCPVSPPPPKIFSNGWIYTSNNLPSSGAASVHLSRAACWAPTASGAGPIRTVVTLQEYSLCCRLKRLSFPCSAVTFLSI